MVKKYGHRLIVGDTVTKGVERFVLFGEILVIRTFLFFITISFVKIGIKVKEGSGFNFLFF